jgi:hypothetical protein
MAVAGMYGVAVIWTVYVLHDEVHRARRDQPSVVRHYSGGHSGLCSSVCV